VNLSATLREVFRWERVNEEKRGKEEIDEEEEERGERLGRSEGDVDERKEM
jgi:hypothetical protein